MGLARQNDIQLVHYLRFKVNFNDLGVATGEGMQTLPKGALVIGTDIIVTTAFNAGTTNVLSVGTEATTFANLATSAEIVAGSPGIKQNEPPVGAALGPLAADAQVFALYTQTGTAATTGAAYVVVKYIPDNDLSVGV